MTSIPCDIVLLPADDLATKAINTSQKLQQFDTLFILQTDRFVPHVSLYMTQLKLADLDKAGALLNDIAAKTQKMRLFSDRYDQAYGYLDAEYQRTDGLGKLQMAVIDALNPIRDGMREKDKARLQTATGKVRENLEKYGYRGVGESFRPHLTLTRFTDERSIDTGRLPKANEFSGDFTHIGLCEMGDNGTCTKKLATLRLSG